MKNYQKLHKLINENQVLDCNKLLRSYKGKESKPNNRNRK